jgi:hypothetical protein
MNHLGPLFMKINFMKNNLMPYLPEWSQIKEFPKEMQR